MIPSVISQQLRQGVEDFLPTTFPVATHHFNGILERLLGLERAGAGPRGSRHGQDRRSEAKVVLGQCGIDIRGRSRKLRINHRTTDETRPPLYGVDPGQEGGARDRFRGAEPVPVRVREG
ncbi:hypothetical protein [Desulfatiglans anilini]|uniref:hypothetical protein n=1 Tax=Desulfatiglans anilini TaxID=90728 RepID=UPI000400F497|nr:hypothetical protein [Desulfatiglans anilini]